jgi:hypothetical protein
MNPFLLSPKERLQDWKTFRNSLAGIPDSEAVARVASYWALAPLNNRWAYDPEDLSDWPGPWEMIGAGEWCRSSVAVGMEFTLRLAGWSPDRMNIMYIRDYDISDQMLILKIDEQAVINYSQGIVTDYPNTRHDVMANWRFVQRNYRKGA